MMCRVAYPDNATHIPHPYTHHRKEMGQFSKFCPGSGQFAVVLTFRKLLWLQCDTFISGLLGRIGQKNPGYTYARGYRGLGVSVLTRKSKTSALCAPRAPPDDFATSFQWVVSTALLSEFCPNSARSALSAPPYTYKIQHLGSYSNETTKYRKVG